MTRPPPLTPPESDLTMYKDMPLEFGRFARSDLLAFATPEGVIAALFLWGTSWHEKPAGSLTNDDRALAKAAGYGRAVPAWLAVKADALRGWIECSDGRLYHPVMAEKVQESWTKRLTYLHNKYRDAVRAFNKRNPDHQREPMSFEFWQTNGRPAGVRDEADSPKQPDLPLETDENVTRTIDKSPSDSPPESVQDRNGTDRNGTESLREVVEGPSLESLAARFGRASGVAVFPSRPKHFADQLDTVRNWLTLGLDPDTEIIPALEQRTLDKPGERHSLAYFTPHLAQLAARKDASHNGARPSDTNTLSNPMARAVRNSLDRKGGG